MKTFLKKLHRGEKGQALLIVLALLAIGGVTIAGSLNYATTVMNENRILADEMESVYAATAGIDYAIWALENGEETPAQLDETLNGMSVNITENDLGFFTMYCGDMAYVGSLPQHYDWITVNGTAVCEGSSCNYTVSAYWQGDTGAQRRLVDLGVSLPVGYSFVPGSPAEFVSNITTDDPDETGTAANGAEWLKWTWKPGQGPFIDETTPLLTQTFRITGSGEMDGDYCWVAAQSNDVGLVGEITGQRLQLTATAADVMTGTVLSEVIADIVLTGGTAYIASWQIVR